MFRCPRSMDDRGLYRKNRWCFPHRCGTVFFPGSLRTNRQPWSPVPGHIGIHRISSVPIAIHRCPSHFIATHHLSSRFIGSHRDSSVPGPSMSYNAVFFGIAVPLWPDRPICGFRMPSTGIHRRWVVGRRFWYRVFRHTLHESLGILRKFFVNPRRSFAQGFKELSKNRQNPFSFYGRPRHLRRVGMADSGKRYEKTGPVVAGGRLGRFL